MILVTIVVAIGAASSLLASILLLEVLSSCCGRHALAKRTGASATYGTVAVLVPAHNEAEGILPTIADIVAQLRAGDRVLVVADNCSDDTAAVARSAGAEVIERNDPVNRGKGFALDYGLRHLSQNVPEVVIVVDADCRLAGNLVERLAATSVATGRPVQALYLMVAPGGSALNYQVAEWAWFLKNIVRPLGLHSAGLPCQLVGTGMAFPWRAIKAANFAVGDLVEDVKLGLELAAAGYPPVLCPDAEVRSVFPVSAVGADTQRQRWQQGHLAITATVVPRMIVAAARRRDAGLLALALDMTVPPLSLLALLLAAGLMITGMVVAAGGPTIGFLLTLFACFSLAAALTLAWSVFGRKILPFHRLLRLGPYVLGNISLYRRLVSGGRAKHWIRTERR